MRLRIEKEILQTLICHCYISQLGEKHKTAFRQYTCFRHWRGRLRWLQRSSISGGRIGVYRALWVAEVVILL